MVADVQSYLDLVTAQYQDKPDFNAVLTAFLQAFVDEQNVIETLVAKYDLDVTIGTQEDVVGQWVGFNRRIPAVIDGVYFSFDTPNLGFDQGVWFGPNSPVLGVISLDDATYRLMLKAKIQSNYWNGSLQQLQEIFTTFFAVSPGTFVAVFDNQDMTMTIALAGVIPGEIYQKLFLRTMIPYPPAAVGSNVIIVSEPDTPMFGLDVENDYMAGLDVGSWTVPVI